MLELGKKQRLKVVKKVDFGVYLAEEDGDKKEDRVLLPAKQVPEGAGPGTELEVFLYKDSSDRLIATTREPRLTLGETALLTVAEGGKNRSFSGLGPGKRSAAALPGADRAGKKGRSGAGGPLYRQEQRLCATMKVYHYLKQHSPYVIGDQVKGRVYEISRNFGVFVAVDDQYSALIPRREAQGRYQVGQELSLRVTEVKEDGKLTVSARQKAYLQIGQDAELVLEAIEKAGGRLDFDDKASPEKIDEELGLSKAAFKRAVGHLLKEGKIQLEPGKILLK